MPLTELNSLRRLSSVQHTCHCDGTAATNFSDTRDLVKANGNSHYRCSEVSLTYCNAHISRGCNLPCVLIIAEDLGVVFFHLCLLW